MRALKPSAAILGIALSAGLAPPAEAQQQTNKYVLVIVASGTNDGDRRDGVAMLNIGVYPGRQECEAAGKNVSYGQISGGDMAGLASAYLCVPLGRP